MTLNSSQLRKMDEERALAIRHIIKRRPVYLILEDILDTYNIGGFFRLADAVAAEKVYLCGESATPPNPKITKASVGTYKLVPWEYRSSAAAAIKELQKIKKMKVIAVEQHPGSKDYRKIKYHLPLAVVFGNETAGIKPETLKLVDNIAEIPMHGFNKSLNVMVAAGIILYQALKGQKGMISANSAS